MSQIRGPGVGNFQKPKKKEKKIIKLFSENLETNIEPSGKEYLELASTALETVDNFEIF